MRVCVRAWYSTVSLLPVVGRDILWSGPPYDDFYIIDFHLLLLNGNFSARPETRGTVTIERNTFDRLKKARLDGSFPFDREREGDFRRSAGDWNPHFFQDPSSCRRFAGWSWATLCPACTTRCAAGRSWRAICSRRRWRGASPPSTSRCWVNIPSRRNYKERKKREKRKRNIFSDDARLVIAFVCERYAICHYTRALSRWR